MLRLRTESSLDAADDAVNFSKFQIYVVARKINCMFIKLDSVSKDKVINIKMKYKNVRICKARRTT